jgi:hypothetical protein
MRWARRLVVLMDLSFVHIDDKTIINDPSNPCRCPGRHIGNIEIMNEVARPSIPIVVKKRRVYPAMRRR